MERRPQAVVLPSAPSLHGIACPQQPTTVWRRKGELCVHHVVRLVIVPQEAYDETQDESRGSDTVISMNEQFSDIRISHVGVRHA
jgi:hypothetical protein